MLLAGTIHAGALLQRSAAAAPHPPQRAHRHRRACCTASAAPARALHNECFTSLLRRGRGFLPAEDPLTRLSAPSSASASSSSSHNAWEDALSALPQLMSGSPDALRAALLSLPPLDAAALIDDNDERQLWRAQLIVSFLAHAFVWCGPQDAPPPEALPPVLAAPWVALSTALEVPPVLTYASYNLLNWRRIDANVPIRLGNIVSLHGFTDSADEDQFRMVHIAIEARAGAALAALEHARRCAAQRSSSGHAGDNGDAADDDDADAAALEEMEEMAAALREMQTILARLPERCDPSVYYHRVRRPLAGWRGSPSLPAGLFYEGVGDAAPRQYYGASGAQSSILHAFDAALGVRHSGATLRPYLEEMRLHAPRQHRAWLEDSSPELLRAAALRARSVALRHAYNDAVEELSRFRAMHRDFAAAYISAQSGAAKGGAGGKGTGGTDYVPALAGYHRATDAAKLLQP
jgi:indoleamine 2,3-dioxygenase